MRKKIGSNQYKTQHMNCLITGSPGVGKSAVGKLLQLRGYPAIDADSYVHNGVDLAVFQNEVSGKRPEPGPLLPGWRTRYSWMWRIDVLQQLLCARPSGIRIVCGYACNAHKVWHLFDRVFVLTADNATISHRLDTRVLNDFGKDPAELALVLDRNETWAEVAAETGGIIIDAVRSLDVVVDEILALIGIAPGSPCFGGGEKIDV